MDAMRVAFLLLVLVGFMRVHASAQTDVALDLTPPQREAVARAIASAALSESIKGAGNQDAYAAAMDALAVVVDDRLLAQAQGKEGESLDAKFIVLAWEKRTHPERISGVFDEFIKFVPDERVHSGQVGSPSVTKDGGKWVAPDYRLSWEYHLVMPVSYPRHGSEWTATEALGRIKDPRSLVLYLPVAQRAAAGRVGTTHRARGSSGMLKNYLRSALEYRTAPALKIAVKIMYMRYSDPAVSEKFEGDANFSRASGCKRAWIREKEI
jgi:hypothetical protein